ncbi:MerR family transcriptional regulator [Carnobacterium gallinarum]|uniref:MerR family transcriptional regulator n=1 Tax=Carnobacterium gallinarum TaxID=2749 RepID=UPI0005514FB8|nr:MerR family transcriptional regulator [Carnobacterium gallinarum]
MSLTIGAFSKKTGLTPDTIRYYEQEEIIQVERNSQGHRIFNDEDLVWVAFVKKLKDTGMPIKKMKLYAKLRYEGESTMPERLALLEEHRIQVVMDLQQLSENLSNLDRKIEFYQKSI